MDKRDLRKIFVLGIMFIATILVYGGYSIRKDSLRLQNIMKSKNAAISRTTGYYSYTIYLNEEKQPYIWDIKAGKDRSLNNIVENTSNVNYLNKFHEAVDKLYMIRTNLILYLLVIIFTSLTLIALRNKEKSYHYGFAKGLFVAILIVFIYISINSTTDYYRVTKDIKYYYERVQIR